MTKPGGINEFSGLRAFVAEAWKARSVEERRAFAASVLVDGESIAAAPQAESARASASDNSEWGPALDLTFAPPADTWQPPVAPPQRVEPTRRLSEEVRAPAPRPLAYSEAEVEAIVRKAELRAALSGATAPSDLVTGTSKDAEREALDRLAARCDRTLVDAKQNRWLWTLGAARRRVVLGELDPLTLGMVLHDLEAVPTDPAGQRLRAYAHGDYSDASDFRQMTTAKLQVEVQALAWVLPLKPTLASLLDAARRAIETSGLLSGFESLLRDGFFGRERETERIRHFATMLPAGRHEAGPVLVLGVSGIGGSGKSTLLAHALRPMVEEALLSPAAPLVVQLDFDRSSFLDGGELEWSFELSRQIGLFAPDLEKQLAALRARSRTNRVQRGEDAKEDYALSESLHRDGSSFDQEVGSIVVPARLAQRGLLIVLDTFEEWQREAWSTWDKNAPAHRVIEWVLQLAYVLDVRPRLIVSGRAPAGVSGYMQAVEPVELGELSSADARALLAQLGLSRSAARRLANLIGGNPLMLKLAARHYLAMPIRRRVAFLRSRQGGLPEGTDAALRQGLLYRRFLDHIRDPEVQQLAHPGLALRRVTPELVEHVLAGPCNLGQIDSLRARDLLEKLEREVWLVARHGDALVHRPDVRRAMLRQMTSDPELGPRVRAVHEAALRWFTARNRDETEAAYHRLALGETAAIESGGIGSDLLHRLVESADDFAPNVRALIRSEMGLKLSQADLKLLPEARRRRSAEKRAADLVQRGQPGGALRYWNTGGYPPVAAPWYIQAAFQTPDWGTPVPFAKEPPNDELAGGRLAYAYLLAFARQSTAQRTAELDSVNRLQEAQLKEGRARPINETLLENLYFRRVTNGDASFEGDLESFAGGLDLSAARLTATDFRRIATVLPLNSAYGRFDISRLLTQSYRPSVEWLRKFAQRVGETGGNPAILHPIIKSIGMQSRDVQRSYTDEPTAGVEHLLGNYGDRFAEAVREAFGVLPPPVELLSLIGWRGDDPEWRVPIRETLADAYKTADSFAQFAHGLDQVFDVFAVSADHLISEHRRAPRGMWLNLVEFADRCGALGDLLNAANPDQNPEIAMIAAAYSRWEAACERILPNRPSAAAFA